MRPRIGFAALKLLQHAGFAVYVPETQTCCGQPGFNAGDRVAAQQLARKLIAEFDACDYLVIPSGSCAGTVRTHYAELFAEDAAWRARADALAAKTWELASFLHEVAGMTAPPGHFEGRVTYHDSCSGLRELNVKAQPRALLARMPGVQVVEMAGCEECCGFGGTFAIKYGDLSGAIAGRKCDNIRASGVKTVVLGDLGCMLNIEGRLARMGDPSTKVLHVAEVLAGMTRSEV
ncbi:MAG: (Fe-S)-binding protein [Rhodocyclaceae bacterium]|nr:(Fe-S)-binding protein [Rhodocyclaceae bacterium]MBX3667594.1 (Fe-S)-binding protein [Rhodocyclaceae bacterium]